MQLKQHGSGKELEGWELSARVAGFTPLPFVSSPVQLFEGGTVSASCSVFAQRHSVRICSNLKGQLLAPRLLISHLNPTCSASSPAPASPRGTPGVTYTEQQLLSRWSDSDTDSDRPFWGQQELEKDSQEWVGLYFTHGKFPTLEFCSTQSNDLGKHH